MLNNTVCGVLSVVGLALAMGCSGGDDNKSAGSANGTAAVDACKAYCAAEVAASCGFNADVAACETFEDCATTASVPATCADAIKADYDCRKAVTDICDPGTACEAQFNAIMTACT